MIIKAESLLNLPMEKIIKLNNRSFVTKSSATRLLGFSNHNSIDDLVRRRKMQEFKIQGLAKSFKAVDGNEVSSYDCFFAEHEEEKAFGRELVLALQNNLTDVREIMLAQVKNWDEDRLAPLDAVLIMMAIAEFLYCPHVPVKVTINEYIDISKDYSGPKSKDFINGVIDKAMWALKDAGRIEKLGRGLQNN